MINLDNGPDNSSVRTQFMHRMVIFSDATGLEVKLVYYPPYHSKYNFIERCWGILENHWNGTLLNSVNTVVEWARTMTWKGAHPGPPHQKRRSGTNGESGVRKESELLRYVFASFHDIYGRFSHRE